MAILMVNETAPRLEAAPPSACQILWDLLDQWMALDETRATWEEVEALYGDITGIWRAYPDDADGWYWAWCDVRETCRSPIPLAVEGCLDGLLEQF